MGLAITLVMGLAIAIVLAVVMRQLRFQKQWAQNAGICIRKAPGTSDDSQRVNFPNADLVVQTLRMLAMETLHNVNDSFRLVPLLLVFLTTVLFIVLFREPIGTLLVRLESLQLPFLSARFTKTRQDERLDDDEESDDSQPRTAVRGD